MAIGTAKATPEELAQAPHHFINALSIHENYSIGAFERDALARIKILHQENDFVIVAGGSSMYIKALCQGIDDFPDVDTSVKAALNKCYLENGISALQKKVKEVDPVYFEEVDQSNPHRLLRALAVYEVSGRPFSAF